MLLSIVSWTAGLNAQPVPPSILAVQDTIEASTQWCVDTVRIEDTVWIADGVTVTICPGTHVVFMKHVPIYVDGALKALGKDTAEIVFTNHPSIQGWSGLRYRAPGIANDSSVFTYCRFLRGWANGPDWDSLDCQGTGGAFFVKSWRKIRLSHCSFAYNRSNWSGGAIKMLDSARMVLENCEFFDNRSGMDYDAYSGGAVHMARKCEMVLRNSSFVSNYSPLVGGAIMLVDGSSLEVYDCIFTDNHADNNGGAIAGSLGSGGQLPVSIFIRDSRFETNNAGLNGGAIFGCTSEEEMLGQHQFNILHTVFNKNAAGFFPGNKIEDGHGGAIHVRQTDLILDYCDFTGNVAGHSNQCGHAGAARGVWGSSINVDHCLFEGNIGNHGGALRGDHATIITVDSSQFINNQAYNSGGAIRGSDSCIVTVNDCDFIGNTANYYTGQKPPISGGQGGAIFLCPGETYPSSPSEAYIYDSYFFANGAGSHAGAVKMGEGGLLIMERDTFIDNNSLHSAGALMWGESATGYMTDCYVVESDADQDGGALVIGDGARVTSTNIEFYDNECGKDGGAVKVAQYAWAKFENCRFRMNEAGEKGGALKSSDGDSVFITGCDVDTNTSHRGGGGMMLGESNYGEVSDSRFRGNWSREKGGGLALGKYFEGKVINSRFLFNFLDTSFTCDGGSKGGGLFMGEYGDLVISKCIVGYNVTRDSIARGGGIFAGMESEMSIRQSGIIANRAEGDSAHGGGVFMGEYAELMMDTTSLNFNIAGGHGGGLFCGYSADVRLRLCIISSNSAALHGGGIKLGSESNLIANDLMVEENFATLHGGGLHMCPSGELELHNSRFYNNMSWKGGGLSLNTPDQVWVDHTMFEANTATTSYVPPENYEANGGAVELSGHGWGKAGMVPVSQNPALTFSNCTFRNNAADWNGGAIFLGGSMMTSVNLIQNVIANNSTAHAGGGIFAMNHLLSIVNNTIVNNYSDSIGGGLHYADTDRNRPSTIINTILYGNFAYVDGNQVSLGDGLGGIMLDTSDRLNFYHCDIEGDSADFGGCVTSTGDYFSNVDTLPGFIQPSIYYGPAPDAATANWSLPYASPLRNKGTLDTTGLQLTNLDFVGRPRINTDTIDIGAYETMEGIFLPPLYPDEFCPLDAGVYMPAGQPTGGVYSGPGINGNAFFPAFAGPGYHQLTYTITYQGGLSESASIFVTVHPFDTVSLGDLHVCVDVPSLALSGGTPAGGVYTGPHISGGIFDVNAAGPGTYPVVYSYKNFYGCVSSDTALIHVHPLPVVQLAAMPPVCEGVGSVQLTGGTPSGGTYSGLGVLQGVLSFQAPGQYPYTYTYQDPQTNCQSSTTAVLEVLEDPDLQASADVAICHGACTVISATGAQSYIWSTAMQGASLTVCPQQGTFYTVTGTAANGCSAVDEVLVTVYPPVVADIQPSTPEICKGSLQGLIASGAGLGGKYHWSNGGIGTLIIVSPPQTSTYSVTVTTLEGCTDVASVIVEVLPVPVVQTGEPYAVCQGEQIQLNASGGTAYAWSDGLDPVADPLAGPLDDITYTLTVTGSNGCTASDEVFVNVLMPQLLDLGPDQEICDGDCITFSAPAGMSEYEWYIENPSIHNGSFLPGTTQQTVCPSDYSRVLLTVTDQQGCDSWDEVYITVNQVVVPDILLDTLVMYLGNSELIEMADNSKVHLQFTFDWFPPTFLNSATLREPTTSAVHDILYTVTMTDQFGCQGTDDVFVQVIPDGNSVAGRLTYQNNSQDPLSDVPVNLLGANKSVVATALTNEEGYFSMTQLPAGSYCLDFDADYLFSYNGVNALDALIAMYHYNQWQVLTGLRAVAGDVNGLSAINAQDALLIARRFAGLIPGFAIGEWVYDAPCFTLNGGNAHYLDVSALYTGDVNGSAIPLAKDLTVLPLLTSGEMVLVPGQDLELPVGVGGLKDIGSASIVLEIPEGWNVKDVSLAEGVGGELAWNILENHLHLAWFDVSAPVCIEGAPLFTILAKSFGWNDKDIRVVAPSEITDADGKRGGYLILPALHQPASGEDLLTIYPNPATDVVGIYADFSNSGNAVISLTDILGKEVLRLDQAYNEGKQQVILDVSTLSNGTYLLTLNNGVQTFSKRLIVTR